MNNEETLKASGKWWLPGNSDHKVSGTLHFDPESGGILELMDALRAPFEGDAITTSGGPLVVTSPAEDSGTYTRIHGQDGQTAYTLEDCIVVHSRWNIPSGKSEEKIRIGQILKGAWFNTGELLEASEISFMLDYLPHWVNLGQFKEEHLYLGEHSVKLLGFTLSIQNVEPAEAILSNGVAVDLRHNIGISGDRVAIRTLHQYYHFTARTDPAMMAIEDLIDIGSDFQDLVSIGTGRVAGFRGVCFYRPDIERYSTAGTSLGKLPIDYFVNWNIRSTKGGDLEHHQMYFSYSDIGSIEGGLFTVLMNGITGAPK